MGLTTSKVAGAEVNSSDAALSRGIVTVSAPVQKWLSLAVLSLRSVALPILSSALATRLAGNWTSVLLLSALPNMLTFKVVCVWLLRWH